MEKETVLEIEFTPIWDKWAWKVKKNKLKPGFEFKNLKNSQTGILRLNFGFIIDEHYLINDEEKQRIEKIIKKVNEKHCIRKLWRAEEEDYYYFINNSFEIIKANEYFRDLDNNRWEKGNYLKTETEAKEYSDYMKKCSLKWHEKRENNVEM